MEKLLKPGRIIFATGMIALGILCIILKDFIVGRPEAWPAGFAANPALAYISGAVLIIAAIAILFNIKAGMAALLIAFLIFLLSVLRTIPHLLNDWLNALNAYKAMALLGGALIVAASFFKEAGNVNPASRTNQSLINSLVIAGCILLAAFFIACGYAHFKYAGFVTDFIPAYIPFRPFWTYFTAICLFAGGAGLLIPQTRRWAALLSGIMVLGWFVLLHIPKFVADTNNVSDRLGLCESFTFGGIFFVLAGMGWGKVKL